MNQRTSSIYTIGITGNIPLATSNLCGRRLRASTSRDAAARVARATLQEHAPTSRALEIMHYFGAPMAMENPRTGLLKRQAVIEGIPYKDVTYCMYGFPYRKPTRIWTTLGDYWTPRDE